MDERGVEAEPDLGLVRDLLRCRENGLLDRMRATGRLTEADLEELRRHVAALRSDFGELLGDRRS